MAPDKGKAKIDLGGDDFDLLASATNGAYASTSTSAAAAAPSSGVPNLSLVDSGLDFSDSGMAGKPRPNLIKSNDSENKIASVTLQDCLACSGCVTSAETVLI